MVKASIATRLPQRQDLLCTASITRLLLKRYFWEGSHSKTLYQVKEITAILNRYNELEDVTSVYTVDLTKGTMVRVVYGKILYFILRRKSLWILATQISNWPLCANEQRNAIVRTRNSRSLRAEISYDASCEKKHLKNGCLLDAPSIRMIIIDILLFARFERSRRLLHVFHGTFALQRSDCNSKLASYKRNIKHIAQGHKKRFANIKSQFTWLTYHLSSFLYRLYRLFALKSCVFGCETVCKNAEMRLYIANFVVELSVQDVLDGRYRFGELLDGDLHLVDLLLQLVLRVISFVHYYMQMSLHWLGHRHQVLPWRHRDAISRSPPASRESPSSVRSPRDLNKAHSFVRRIKRRAPMRSCNCRRLFSSFIASSSRSSGICLSTLSLIRSCDFSMSSCISSRRRSCWRRRASVSASI